MRDLSTAQKQMVEVARALAFNAKIIIMDEPTSSLTETETRILLNLIRELKNKGVGIVYVSHRMEEIVEIADTVVVLRDGELVGVLEEGQIERNRIINLMVGREVNEIFAKRDPVAGDVVLRVENLSSGFVKDVSFELRSGEVLGFSGLVGAGRSEIMRALFGLDKKDAGRIYIDGKEVSINSAEDAVRHRIVFLPEDRKEQGLILGLDIVKNTSLAHLKALRKGLFIQQTTERSLALSFIGSLDIRTPSETQVVKNLSGGNQQKVVIAKWMSTNPKILILDEPTSGVDPVARDSFWGLLIDLSRRQGVTIFITTHFMNEGLRCDRISLMNAGKVLACDAPNRLIEARGAACLEDAFIGYMEEAIGGAAARGGEAGKAGGAAPVARESAAAPRRKSSRPRSGLGRMLAYSHNETMQIVRDPVRLAFAFIGSALLMLVFGFGITMDVEDVRYAALDLDQSPESRAYLEQFAAAPRYFAGTPPVWSQAEALGRLQADDISLVLEMPPNFGRNLRRGNAPEVLAGVDGANTFRGETISQYVRGVHQTMLRDPASGLGTTPKPQTADIEERYMYNPTFESLYAIVPGVPALLLILIPAILMAVSVVREKELGSIINFYVTPTGRLEYLLGKQLPYVAIGMLNYFTLVAMATLVFGVPIKGSFAMLTLCTLLYVTATTGIGLVISTFTASQVAAVFVTAILTIVPSIQFSGFLQPVSTLEGQARLIGSIWPTSYYMHSAVGAFTKGLGADMLAGDAIALACCVPLLWAVSTIALKKQER